MRKPGLDGALGRAINAAVFLGALATVPVIVLQEYGEQGLWLTTADWAIWSVFLLEYSIELWLTDDRRKYARRNWLSPLVLVLSFPALPNLLGTVRLARLVRAFRFARLAGVTFRGLTELRLALASRGLAFLALTTGALIVAGGAALTVLEPKTIRGGVVDGIWWAVVTASTVGYGDIAPSTTPGRLIAITLMLSGVGLISTLGACITTYFVGQQENAELREMRDRLSRMEGMLERLVAEREEDSQPSSAGQAEIAAGD